ncbi:hypothetical protein PR202_gb00565 [Eleusine coracana subsp. coracana]|uniref:Glycosyltransferase n=1 Tax=Eleusine coracana subsp. coracana TaxID=191504 RepID=A0AAV5DU81_ELECO|nr:hypothetical protein PR202_gb00565 [Eleusine coracana subsp. coracana]
MAHAEPEESNNGEQGPCYHFLVAVYGIQGHLNPARTFAHNLAQIKDCTVTLSVPFSGHRLMFPSHDDPYEEINDGVITYIPFSDGNDGGIWPKNTEERMQRRKASSKSLSTIVSRLTASARPVTCMVCTLNMPAVIDVAHEHNIPLAIYWIQPATAFLTYYHYFHGHDKIITQHATEPTYEVSLPGLYPLTIRDMPSFLTETTHSELSEVIIQGFRELFMQIDQEKTMVLVNTFTGLEDVALKALQPYVEIFSVGPAVPPLGSQQWPKASNTQIHLFKPDEENYMEWLNVQPEKSVVYLSFGSLLTYTIKLVEEILHGLQDCGRRYLWVVRREGRAEDVDFYLRKVNRGKGMVVEWCDQLRVLSHPSVGCFVTHCGWNSTLEAIVHGVPMV